MFEMLVRNSDFSALSKLISPSFFKVVPLPQLLGVGAKIMGNARNFSIEKPELSSTLSTLSKAGYSLEFEKRPDADGLVAGAEILELYFFQIYACDTWLLDFRKASFSSSKGRKTIWSPGPYHLTLSPEFLQNTRSLYEGFYFNNPAQFETALHGLGVSSAGQILRDHFGLEHQSQIRFKLAEFEQTFAKVFQACAQAGERIAPEFAALGILLLTLYENLEASGEAFDVRSAFLRAHEKAKAEPRSQTP